MQDVIIYTSIIRKERTILCEYTEYSGNFNLLIKRILSKLNNIESEKYRCTFLYGRNQIFCLLDNNIYFLLITAYESSQTKEEGLFFAYLFKLQRILNQKYMNEQLQRCESYSLNDYVNKIKENEDIFNNESRNKFEEFLPLVEKVQPENTLNKKNFECNLNFVIMSIEDVHPDRPKEFDQFELRHSIYRKYKIKKETNISLQSKESTSLLISDNNKNGNREVKENSLTESFITEGDSFDASSWEEINSIDIPFEEPKEFSRKKKKPKKKLVIIILIISVCAIAVIIILLFLHKYNYLF